MSEGPKSTGAVALATGGIASAFSLAACCAIPLFLAGVGVGSAWLAPIVSVSQPHAGVLTAFSLVTLIGSVALVWRASGSCEPGSLRARRSFKWVITGAAAVGLALLALSKIYA